MYLFDFAFSSVPFFIEITIRDVEGNKKRDYMINWGNLQDVDSPNSYRATFPFDHADTPREGQSTHAPEGILHPAMEELFQIHPPGARSPPPTEGTHPDHVEEVSHPITAHNLVMVPNI